jgi:hypothetical protein
VHDRHTGAAADLHHAADIAGGDDVGRQRLERLDLAVLQLLRDFRLHQVVGAGRAAAQVRVGRLQHGEACLGEQRLGWVLICWPCCSEQAA